MGKSKWNRAEFLALTLSSIIGQWGLQLLEVLDGEFNRNSPAGKRKEKKKKNQNIKEPTAVFTLGPVLQLKLFSQRQT